MDVNNRGHVFLDPGPLSPWIDHFAADLSVQRYAPLTIEGYTASAVWFSPVGCLRNRRGFCFLKERTQYNTCRASSQ